MPAYAIPDKNSLKDFARQLTRRIQGGQVYLLRGELGAGKTTLVREICDAMGIAASKVVSPTYTLVQEYEGGALPVVHVDLYRIEPGRALETLDLEERIGQSGCVAFIEWPDAARGLIPAGAEEIRIEFGEVADSRRIFTSFELPGSPIAMGAAEVTRLEK